MQYHFIKSSIVYIKYHPDSYSLVTWLRFYTQAMKIVKFAAFLFFIFSLREIMSICVFIIFCFFHFVK